MSGITALALRLPFHYGWLIVVVAALMSAVTSSIRLSFGVFLDPLEAEFGWSRADMALAYSIQFGMMAVMAVVVGWMADRFGAKKCLIFGGAGFSLSIAATGTSRELWQFYLYYGVIMGIAMACFVTPLHSTTSLWFRRRMGLAVGTVVAFQAVGPLLGAPIFRWLSETMSWQMCFYISGVTSAIALMVAILLFKNRPEDVGVRPYAEEKLTAAQLAAVRAPTVDGNTLLRRAIRTQPFWITISTHFLGCVSHSIPLVFVVSMATFRGIDGVLAASVLGFVSAISIGSKLGMSVIAEHLGGRRVLLAVLALQSTGVLVLLFADQAWQFLLFTFVFGLGYGGEMVVYPMLNRQYYGSAPFAAIYGWQMAGASFGMAVGGYLGGLLFQLMGDYSGAIWLSAVAGYIGVAAAFIMKRPDPVRMSALDPEGALAGRVVATGPSPTSQVASRVAPQATAQAAPPARSGALAEAGGTLGSATPSPSLGTTALSWPDWVQARRVEEVRLADQLTAWAGQTTDPELAEVLEIAAARARDRAFLLRLADASRQGSVNGSSSAVAATNELSPNGAVANSIVTNVASATTASANTASVHGASDGGAASNGASGDGLSGRGLSSNGATTTPRPVSIDLSAAGESARLDVEAELGRLDQIAARLGRYAELGTAPPGDREADLVRHLQESERETLELIEEQRHRLAKLVRREAVRLLDGRATRVLGAGLVAWKPLCSAAAGRPAIVRVSQQPGSIVRLAPGASRFLLPLDGSGLIRSGETTDPTDRADLTLQPKQPIEIGAAASSEVLVGGDLPLTYLLIGTATLEPIAVDAASLAASRPGASQEMSHDSGHPVGVASTA